MFDAEELTKQAIERYKENIAVACSFGKDSIVVLHMALKYKPDIKVMFNNTGVEFPETIKYKEMLVKKWNLNLIETKPIKTFWQCVE
ncbi:phosphoadenosine phosphosulfate reductase family protein, partial [Candidatus Woesearchaeota archaeon]|nr:phosphoadenosine phosphosulfate reductase family protein [Candidatus Woesearchaeota archaeon]